jgi:hypothetical protein
VELHIHDSADGTFGDVVTDPLRADSLYAPFLSPDTGLFALLEGDTLTLEPATRFRALPGTSYALEGPGTAWDDGTLLRWLPPAGSDSLFTLALRATPSVGPEAVDTLRVWLRRAGFTAPQLVCRTQGADLVLEWTEVAGATAYRLERSSHPAFPAEEVVVLQEGPGRDFTDPAVLGPGQAWYRVVALQ